jgi:phosphate transport system substrate-binding protein
VNVLAVSAAVLTFSGLVACSGGSVTTPAAPTASSPAPPTTPASGPRQLSETGSSLMAPLFTQWWAPAYHAQFSQVTLSTASTSSGTGISSAAQLAQVNFQPLPPSVVMLSLAQIAKIKG